MEVKLYVGNLPYLTSDNDLRTLFAQAGTVASAAVIKDQDTGTSKGFGFVTMSTRAEAESAVQLLDNYALGEHSLKVSMARPRTNPVRGYRR
ncbi:MAG TPA: RNA-binding protein [Anaerolineae bacterium]|nr:RNA-binding protein [Anaerolineae bacterium]